MSALTESLALVRSLIVAKRAELTADPVRKVHSRPAGAPRALFLSMQRDLNRAMTTAEFFKHRKTTFEELANLESRALDLERQLAEEGRLAKQLIITMSADVSQAAAAFENLGKAINGAAKAAVHYFMKGTNNGN